MRYRLNTVLLASALLATSCSSLTWGSDRCADLLHAPVKVMGEPELKEVSAKEANVSLDVTSGSRSAVRTKIRIGDALALDVELPAALDDCGHEPVYSYSYQLPPGPVTVTATTDDQRQTVPLKVVQDQRWVVLQVQDGFPLSLKVWRQEPQWG